MNKTNKIWIGIVVLLVVLNLTTIGTILYRNYRENSDDIAISLSEEGQNRISEDIFVRHWVLMMIRWKYSERQIVNFNLLQHDLYFQLIRLKWRCLTN